MSTKAASITDRTGALGSGLDAETSEPGREEVGGKRLREQKEGDGACAAGVYVIVSLADVVRGDLQVVRSRPLG